ncbi:MAG: phage integrase N-terminal SAM-like domain-containing protein [Deltaproteobacteria bacterium]|nr:phage integrase N-terminal SAM-like domain-containing protein [Deltaproteobacteria bacterium]
MPAFTPSHASRSSLSANAVSRFFEQDEGSREGSRLLVGQRGAGHPPKLLDRVRAALRVRHYALRTEQAYIGWIRRYIHFHALRHPDEMGSAEASASRDEP